MADKCRRYFKSIFSIYRKVLRRMTYWFSLYAKQLTDWTAICNFVGLRGITACYRHGDIAWICAVMRSLRIRWTALNRCSNCMEMRRTAAPEFIGLRGYATRKIRRNPRSRSLRGNASCEYVPKLRLECAWREWDACGKCGSSAAQVRGSTHWRVPYLYGTGTLRVNTCMSIL